MNLVPISCNLAMLFISTLTFIGFHESCNIMDAPLMSELEKELGSIAFFNVVYTPTELASWAVMMLYLDLLCD